MRIPLMAAWALVMLTATAGPASEDDSEAAIRLQVKQYEEALLSKGKDSLDLLLHKDYRLVTVRLGIHGEADKPQAISYYTDSTRDFVSLKSEISNIRLFGDTAIETGSFNATVKEFGQTSWLNMRYTRIWIREAGGWRLAHECA